MTGNLLFAKWILLGHCLPKTRGFWRRDCHRQCYFSFCFHLQTHQVLSEARKSDADKREKVLDLYVRTEQFLKQLDTDFTETLQTSLGDFKTTLKENIKNVGPRDQYIVLVAGKSLRVIFLEETSNTFLFLFELVFAKVLNSLFF